MSLAFRVRVAGSVTFPGKGKKGRRWSRMQAVTFVEVDIGPPKKQKTSCSRG